MNRLAANRFYASPRWRILRARMVADAEYRCSECGALDGHKGYWGRLELHHKTPLRAAPKKALERDNLIVLCRQCHSDLHAKDRETDPARKAWVNQLKSKIQEVNSQ